MRTLKTKTFLLTTVLLLSSFKAFAAANFSFEGYLSDAAGNPISGSATVRLKVVSPGAEACLLFEETHNVTLSADGYVSLAIGAGSRVDALAHSVDRAYANYGTFSGLSCSGGGSTYTPAAGAKRLLNVTVTAGANTEVLGSLDIQPVAVAANAEKLGAHTVGSVLRVENAGVPSMATALTLSDWSSLQSLIAGTSSQYMQSNTGTTGASLPVISGAPGTPSNGSIWYDSVTNQIKYYNGSVQTISAGGGGVATVTGTAPLTVSGTTSVSVSMTAASVSNAGYLTSADWALFNSKLGPATAFSGDVSGTYSALNLSNTGVAAGTYTKVVVDAKGRVLSASQISGGDINSALGYAPLNKTGDTMTGVLGLYATASDPSTGGWTATEKGRTWFNTSSNQIKYWDGSSIQVLGTAGAGLTSLNGETGGAQTFTTSTGGGGTSPQVSSSSNIHTFQFPSASSPGVTHGLVSYADYTSWNGKLDSGSAFGGDIGGSYNSISVNKLQGSQLNISAPAAGQILRHNGTNWVNTTLNPADIAGIIPVSQGGTNSSSFSANRIIASNGTGSSLVNFTCALNQVISFDASGNAICSNVNSLAPMALDGGNSVGAAMKLGTTNGWPLHLAANNTIGLTVTPSGNVGIGTTNPLASLEVTGQIKITGGAPAAGKFLMSDATGLGSWTNFPLVGNTSTYTTYGQNTNATGTGMVAIGNNAGYNYTGSGSTIVGDSAVNTGGAGAGNVVIGSGAASGSALNGNYNTLIGAQSNTAASVGSGVAIGKAAYVAGNGGVAIGAGANAPGGSIVIGVNPSGTFQERIRVDSTGNVGIGTTTPTAMLHVNGPIKVGSGSAATINGFLRTSSSWSAAGGTSVNSNSSGSVNIPVSGATAGDSVICNPDAQLQNGVSYYCFAGSGFVTVVVTNPTATMASGLGVINWSIMVIK